MIYNNNFLQDRALDKLLVSFSSILLDFLFNKLSKTKQNNTLKENESVALKNRVRI